MRQACLKWHVGSQVAVMGLGDLPSLYAQLSLKYEAWGQASDWKGGTPLFLYLAKEGGSCCEQNTFLYTPLQAHCCVLCALPGSPGAHKHPVG